MPVLHDEAEHRAFFAQWLHGDRRLVVARTPRAPGSSGTDDDVGMLGFCAFRPGWIDQLYVDSRAQNAGIGAALLRFALARGTGAVRLWTFQRNTVAIRFYERHGFVLERRTDGRDNEEREPDALYVLAVERDEIARDAPGDERVSAS